LLKKAINVPSTQTTDFQAIGFTEKDRRIPYFGFIPVYGGFLPSFSQSIYLCDDPLI
jgi:hypothetical protein